MQEAESAGREKGVFVVYGLAGIAALGGLLFGYDTAVIAGANDFLQKRFELTELQKGWATASALIGCIIGAASAGAVGDRLGRKRSLLLTALLFLVSAVGSALPRNLTEFALARIVGGVGVGAAALLSPLYIAEIAPARIRGRLVSLNQLAIIGGMVVVYLVNASIVQLGDKSWLTQTGWRWMFASETLPAFLFFVLLLFVPESPRYLAKQGKLKKALRVLERTGGGEKELAAIQESLTQTRPSVFELLRPGLRTALLVGVILAVLQQVTGINVVMYYAPSIFKKAGMTIGKAAGSTVIVGIVNLLFTLVAIAVVDRVGRKVLLLVASAGMGLSLVALALAFASSRLGSWQVVAATLAYVAFFAVAMGPVVWVVLSEIYPTQIRGRAMSVATFFLWTANFFVSLLFPPLLKHFGGNVFYLYAVLCAVAFLFVLTALPETKGRTLEEIQAAWLA